MAEAGVTLPPLRKFRPPLRRALRGAGEDLLPGAANPLIAEILDSVGGRRLVLSYDAFLATHLDAFSERTIYPEAAMRCVRLRDLFPGHDVSFLMGIRNPATLIPELFEASTAEDFASFVSAFDLGSLRWSDTIEAIRGACPDVPLTSWCHEDLPMIWPDALRAMAGLALDEMTELEGDFAILHQVMQQKGLARLKEYLRDNPPEHPASRRRIVSAFLDKYAEPEAIAPEIDLPGWTADLIAGLSAGYEADVARIMRRDDVRFLTP